MSAAPAATRRRGEQRRGDGSA